MPLLLMPPQGASRKVGCEQLIQTTPASNASATRSARSRSADMTAAARPNSLSFASVMASSSLSNVETARTGTEDLFLPDAGVGWHIRENRGLKKVALVEMRGDGRRRSRARRFVSANVDIVQDLVVWGFADERPEKRARRHAVADGDFLGFLGKPVDEFRRDALLDDHA